MTRPRDRSVYSYDDAGRLTGIVSVDQEGNERLAEIRDYTPDGRQTRSVFVPKLDAAVGFAVTDEYADQPGGRPNEVHFRDAEGRLLRRLILHRDPDGRLLEEQIYPGDAMPSGIQAELDSLPPAERQSATALFASLQGPDLMMAYAYDPKGRMVERRLRMGDLGGHRAVFRYDDYDNKVEETTLHTSREMQIDAEGHFQTVNERSDQQDARLDYRYDTRGNWIERLVWIRHAPEPDFHRSNIERRQIAYYSA